MWVLHGVLGCGYELFKKKAENKFIYLSIYFFIYWNGIFISQKTFYSYEGCQSYLGRILGRARSKLYDHPLDVPGPSRVRQEGASIHELELKLTAARLERKLLTA